MLRKMEKLFPPPYFQSAENIVKIAGNPIEYIFYIFVWQLLSSSEVILMVETNLSRLQCVSVLPSSQEAVVSSIMWTLWDDVDSFHHYSGPQQYALLCYSLTVPPLPPPTVTGLHPLPICQGPAIISTSGQLLQWDEIGLRLLRVNHNTKEKATIGDIFQYIF